MAKLGDDSPLTREPRKVPGVFLFGKLETGIPDTGRRKSFHAAKAQEAQPAVEVPPAD